VYPKAGLLSPIDGISTGVGGATCRPHPKLNDQANDKVPANQAGDEQWPKKAWTRGKRAVIKEG
jgi:hypothetical protein